VPRVGLFSVVSGKPIVDGLPWTEVPSLAGFRTSALGHPEFWARLQQGSVVPQGMPYEDCPRGRVNRSEARYLMPSPWKESERPRRKLFEKVLVAANIFPPSAEQPLYCWRPGECRQSVLGVAAGPKFRQNGGARDKTRLRVPDSDDAAGPTKGF